MHPIREIIRRFGWDLHRIQKLDPNQTFASMLNRHSVNLVFDVGANAGQFARSLRADGYKGRIVSFEPLSVLHRRMSAASSGDPLWIVADRMALGNKRGSATINVAGNDGESSSILPMLDTVVSAVPSAAYTGTETVDVIPLDEVAPKYLSADDRPFLKLDVQGFESDVLDGGPSVSPGPSVSSWR